MANDWHGIWYRHKIEKHRPLFALVLNSTSQTMKYCSTTVRQLRSNGPRFAFVIPIILAIALANAWTLGQSEPSPADDAVAAFNMGQDAHEKGDLKSAIEYYQKALKLIPEFPEAAYQAGVAYLALGRRSEAESSLRKAVELRPDWTLALTALGSLLVDDGRYQEADALLSKALELDEQNAAAIAAIAEMRLKQNASQADLKVLLAKIEYLTAKAKPTASIWSARAALENAVGKTSAARASVAKAMALDARNRYALEETAEFALADGDQVRATEAVAALEKLAPDASGTKILKARLLAGEGKTADAIKTLDSLDANTAGVADLRSRIVIASSENGAELEAIAKKDPKNVVALGRLCSVYRVSSPAKALEFCRQASEAEPGNIDHAIGFGAALLQANQYEQAVALFRKLVAIAPDNSTVHADLATALFQLKRYQEAKSEFRWLADHQPGLAITYYFLGITHDQLAEYMDAMANYQQFLRLADPVRSKLEIDRVNLRLPILQKQIGPRNSK